MKNSDFIEVCQSLYELSEMQREHLVGLLESRIWIYEGNDRLTIECLYELGDHVLGSLLDEINNEQLAYAILGTSSALQEKINRSLSQERQELLNQTIKEITPARLSMVEEARNAITEVIDKRVSEGKFVGIAIADQRINIIGEAVKSNSLDDYGLDLSFFYALLDSDFRALLKYIEKNDLTDFLWYVNDSRLTRRVLVNLTNASAAALVEDLYDRYLVAQIRNGERYHSGSRIDPGEKSGIVLAAVSKAIHRIVDAGQISILPSDEP